MFLPNAPGQSPKVKSKKLFLLITTHRTLMIRNLSIENFVQLDAAIPVADVRTPAEFDKGHITGAHNIPLFSNLRVSREGSSPCRSMTSVTCKGVPPGLAYKRAVTQGSAYSEHKHTYQ